MEKVIAFKAFNGRLFETEEKCLAYEKKYAEYPKVKYTTIPQEVDGVVKCVKSTWEKPSSQRKDESYFLVGDKFKLFSWKKRNVDELTHISFISDSHEPLIKIAAKVILENGGTFNTKLAEKVRDIYDERRQNAMAKNPYRFIGTKAEITETDNKTFWEIEDKLWRSGSCGPYDCFVRIEKE